MAVRTSTNKMTLENLTDKLKDKILLHSYLKIKGFAVLLGKKEFSELKNSCLFQKDFGNQFKVYGKNYDLHIVETHAESQCEIYSNL